MKPRRFWPMPLILLALFIAGGLALWLSQNLVQRSEEVYTGYGEEARRNPFYTAERLLARLGLTVHGVRRLRDLPETLPPSDTLLVAIPTYALSAGAAQRLLDWVAAGGHLLIGVQHEYTPGEGLDHVLNRLQISSRRAEAPLYEPVAVALNAAPSPLSVRFRSDLRLNDAFWLSLRWGQGRVTLLSDLGLFANDRLSDHDHADFLWALVQHHPGGAVWLQYRALTPSLAQLLWQHGWMPLLGLLLTLLAALWRSSQRLGPLLVAHSAEQRRLGEHLRASSRFLWRHGAGPLLLHAARHYTLLRLQRRPSSAALETHALTDTDQPLSETDLIHILQTLQRLHRHPP